MSLCKSLWTWIWASTPCVADHECRPRAHTDKKKILLGVRFYRRFMFLLKFLDTVYSERSRGGERGLPNRILIWKELD